MNDFNKRELTPDALKILSTYKEQSETLGLTPENYETIDGAIKTAGDVRKTIFGLELQDNETPKYMDLTSTGKTAIEAGYDAANKTIGAIKKSKIMELFDSTTRPATTQDAYALGEEIETAVSGSMKKFEVPLMEETDGGAFNHTINAPYLHISDVNSLVQLREIDRNDVEDAIERYNAGVEAALE